MAHPFARPTVQLGRWSIGALVGLLWLAALLVGWRRLAGALAQPLHWPVLLLVGVLVAAVAAGLRTGWRRLAPQTGTLRPAWVGWAVGLLPTLAVVALGGALSLRGTHPGALAAFWAVLVAGELGSGWPTRRPNLRPRDDRPSERDQQASLPEPLAPVPAAPAATAGPPAEDVLQQLTRSQAVDGSEHLSGWLRMPFAAGQRTANVHVAFCPPFARTPQLRVEQLGGPSARIKTAQLLPYGVRLDLKLAAAVSRPESVVMQFSASSQEEG
ncbi:MAG: hypothetical protein JXB62_20065 [Pirellulales bacterium]|nr:hypothetical protein [Pirellulales bacterium]